MRWRTTLLVCYLSVVFLDNVNVILSTTQSTPAPLGFGKEVTPERIDIDRSEKFPTDDEDFVVDDSGSGGDSTESTPKPQNKFTPPVRPTPTPSAPLKSSSKPPMQTPTPAPPQKPSQPARRRPALTFPTDSLQQGPGSGDDPEDLVPDSSSGDGEDTDSQSTKRPKPTRPTRRPYPPTKQLTRCQKDRQNALRRTQLGVPVPECTNMGEFVALQCHHDGFCWCVTTQGGEISGSRRRQRGSPDEIQMLTKEYCERQRINAGRPSLPDDTNNLPDAPMNPPSDIDSNLPSNVPREREPRKRNSNSQQLRDNQNTGPDASSVVLGHPGVLAGIIGGAVVGLLLAILLVMFLVYRLRKRDQPRYMVDEPELRSKTPMLYGGPHNLGGPGSRDHEMMYEYS